MKLRLDSYDDDLPLGKILRLSVLNIVVKSVFHNENKYYLQIHIHGCEYECEYEPYRIYIAFFVLTTDFL